MRGCGLGFACLAVTALGACCSLPSLRRSAAVKGALVTRYGIEGGRLSTGGYGESRPQATNDTPEGRARNRRVELRCE